MPKLAQKILYYWIFTGRLALCNFCLIVFAFVFTLSITGKQSLPGGSFFGLFLLLLLSHVIGFAVSRFGLPPLLGMLLTGCLLRNLPEPLNVGEFIDVSLSATIRNVALAVILIRAGLGLDPQALRKLSWTVLRLSFAPCLVEACMAALTTHLILGLPWSFGFLTGFVLAAVSPAVVVPSMLNLQERKLGTGQGIPTLVIAAASVDDVLAITGFGVVLGITFASDFNGVDKSLTAQNVTLSSGPSPNNLTLSFGSNSSFTGVGDVAFQILRGPLEALLGVAYGCLVGAFLWFVPHGTISHRLFYRFSLLLLAGLLALFGTRALDLSGAGALACLCVAFVSALQWRLPEHNPTISRKFCCGSDVDHLHDKNDFALEFVNKSEKKADDSDSIVDYSDRPDTALVDKAKISLDKDKTQANDDVVSDRTKLVAPDKIYPEDLHKDVNALQDGFTSSGTQTELLSNKTDSDRIATAMNVCWTLCLQPLLFGLIGNEVVLSRIQPGSIGLGLVCLLIGLVVRMIVSFAAVVGSGLSLKEKLFIPIAWLPKATVQAAIGSVALDTARMKHAPDHIIGFAEQTLTLAVLSIIVTAPLGAALIALLAPRLLKVQTEHDEVSAASDPTPEHSSAVVS